MDPYWHIAGMVVSASERRGSAAHSPSTRWSRWRNWLGRRPSQNR